MLTDRGYQPGMDRLAMRALHGLRSVIFGRAHDNVRRDGIDLRQHAQNFGVEMLVRRKIRSLDPQQIFHRTGDVVTFPHFRTARNRALERLLCGLGVLTVTYATNPTPVFSGLNTAR